MYFEVREREFGGVREATGLKLDEEGEISLERG